MRESVRLVLSQQLAGIRFTIWTSKSESVVKSTNVVEHRRCRVYGRCWVYERCPACRCATEVVESNVSGSWVHDEPAGPREVRLQASWTCWNERGSSCLVRRLERDVRDRWRDGRVTGGSGKTVTSSQSVLLPGELWVESTIGSFGSSSTESPADGTDDRPPWRTF